MYNLNDTQIDEIKNLADLDLNIDCKYNWTDHKDNLDSQHYIYDVVNKNVDNYIKRYLNNDFDTYDCEKISNLIFTGITGYDYNESVLDNIITKMQELKLDYKNNQ